jgi:hypothetical protein
MLYVVITANRNGYLQPCGCTGIQKDYGLAVQSYQLSTLESKFRRENAGYLLLDGGDFASGEQNVTATITKAFALMNYSAILLSTHHTQPG